MSVSDLRHFLDLPNGTPISVVRRAELLQDVVRAGTAGEAGAGWVSALPCRRDPGKRRCPGRMVVRRIELSATITWECTHCGDAGSISGWQDTPSDLRRRSHMSTDPTHDINISHDAALSLRAMMLLDVDCERVIYGARNDGVRVILIATDEQLEDLVGYLATEADHETNRGRRLRLAAAYDELRQARDAFRGATGDVIGHSPRPARSPAGISEVDARKR